MKQTDKQTEIKMVADKVDMSLDDIISSNRKSRGGARVSGGSGPGGRGAAGRGGRVSGAGGARGGPDRSRPRQQSGNRSIPYSRPKQIPDKWEHDMHDNVARGAVSEGGAASRPSLSTGTKLIISNLDFGVTDADIKELFSEFGSLKKSMINYDGSGRSHGTADVTFVRKEDAIKAVNTYKGVPLDGRAMQIEIATTELPTREAPQRRLSGGGGGGGFRGGRGGGRGAGFRSGGGDRDSFRERSGTGGRGRGRGAGGRGGGGGGRGRGGRDRKPAVSKEDLDKELDSYISEAS